MSAHRLLDGTQATVRPIRPADADALVEFHGALSAESQRLRFFGVHPHLSVNEVTRFTTVDHCDREAFVVVAESEILGVGRYDRLLDASAAEVAFATRDDHQGLGVARALFAALATAAYAVGITQFVAETLPENHKMLDVFTHTGLVSGRAFGRGVVNVTMSLVDAKGAFRLDSAERAVPSD